MFSPQAYSQHLKQAKIPIWSQQHKKIFKLFSHKSFTEMLDQYSSNYYKNDNQKTQQKVNQFSFFY
ncbi:hypothetical protein TTHERM_000198017 (macronuclear) [Tetrahymena thermophila SB210]|uniref:Uncharacterized protein n=1 Tax=Tetrahymena thermophila (strain SB210) TaxID=312017 RepID=W7XFK1_TETTS|nr:hypothetical protein TTHERM_000198017 [Tetrahymena thermophila SB210]EWS76627.1 hypothetical protein TTHERM_000198017 [Tetrahymena thermophila SB210]|eukprot:XP_012650795.1 hypothetical protein TTHERM_000198017 [Tetrahymena thermophila SB210]